MTLDEISKHLTDLGFECETAPTKSGIFIKRTIRNLPIVTYIFTKDKFLYLDVSNENISKHILKSNLPANTLIYKKLSDLNDTVRFGTWFIKNVDNKPISIAFRYSFPLSCINALPIDEILNAMNNEVALTNQSIEIFIKGKNEVKDICF